MCQNWIWRFTLCVLLMESHRANVKLCLLLPALADWKTIEGCILRMICNYSLWPMLQGINLFFGKSHNFIWNRNYPLQCSCLRVQSAFNDVCVYKRYRASTQIQRHLTFWKQNKPTTLQDSSPKINEVASGFIYFWLFNKTKKTVFKVKCS